MTSALNHLPQLSGNKMLRGFAFLVVVFMFSACAAQQPVPMPEKKQRPNDSRRPSDYPRIIIDEKDGQINPAQKPQSLEEDSLDILFPVTIKEKYKIALLMPFNLKGDETGAHDKSFPSIGQSFYKGFLMATDSLKKCGMNLEIYVFDVYKNKWYDNKKIRDSLKALDVDLVFGSLTDIEIKPMLKFSEQNKINVVSPAASIDSCFKSNYYFESNPSQSTYGKVAADVVRNGFKDHKIMLLNEYKTASNPMSKAFVEEKLSDSLQVINWNGLPGYSITPRYHFWEDNVIFISSKNEVFVSAILSQLKISAKDMTIIGLYPWLYFKSQEGEVWQKYNLHLLTPYFVNNKDEDVKNFTTTHREKYNDEPDEWSFRGYDEMLFYGRMMGKYGKYFQRYLSTDNNRTTFHTVYQFEKNDCSPWRNKTVHVLYFENYEFYKMFVRTQEELENGDYHK
ncbi:MAG: ABC transporter substrate-binding protein [Bacteroidetes bacterium]|nr:ABC transporter substrate-binding protein [Bacteroidota bacterium]